MTPGWMIPGWMINYEFLTRKPKSYPVDHCRSHFVGAAACARGAAGIQTILGCPGDDLLVDGNPQYAQPWSRFPDWLVSRCSQWQPDGLACAEPRHHGFPGKAVPFTFEVFSTLATSIECPGSARQ